MAAELQHENLVSLQRTFDAQASAYEKQVGNITRRYVRHILERVPAITSASVVHDNACGPGTVSDEILRDATKEEIPRVVGTDTSEAMVATFASLIEAKAWKPKVTAQVMDGSDLSAIPDDTFTHSITNFGFFVFPDSLAAAKHIYRTLRPGGYASITTWSYPRQVYLAHAIVHEIRPQQSDWWPLGKNWLDKDWIMNIFHQAGFKPDDIICETIADFGKYDSGEEFRDIQTNGWLKEVRKGWSEEENGRWHDVCWEMMTDREKQGYLDQEAYVFTLRKGMD